jgi:hypothetical protein
MFAMLLAVPAVALSACAATPTSAEDHRASEPPSASDGALADSVGDPLDTSIAATCAAYSAMKSTIENAHQRMTDHTLSQDQYSAVLESSYYGFVTLSGNPGQRGLTAEVDTLLKLIGDTPNAAAETLDPSSEAFYGATEPISRACAANNSKVTIFAAGG